MVDLFADVCTYADSLAAVIQSTLNKPTIHCNNGINFEFTV